MAGRSPSGIPSAALGRSLQHRFSANLNGAMRAMGWLRCALAVGWARLGFSRGLLLNPRQRQRPLKQWALRTKRIAERTLLHRMWCDLAFYRTSKYAPYPNPAPMSDPTTTSLTKCIPRMTRDTAMLTDRASRAACNSG